ncbi:MAG: glycosyltransferase family 39 protein [Planctomycetaceae bacterium]|nr:glycosyltransferase family 39 protein [Planctomycetaceae bacterium]
MTEPSTRHRVIDRLATVLEWALGLRIAAADVVQWFAQREGSLCVFPDTTIYWLLAGTIRDGAPYEVLEWGDAPHFALRTPGYPLFLALCRLLFGDRTLAVRLVQAGLGTLGVWLVSRLTARVAPDRAGRCGWPTPLVAAALAAFDPYVVASSALILSEAVFVPLMLASLWGLAALWPGVDEASPPRRARSKALLTGVASGAAVLVRPSWAPAVPALLLAWVVAGGRGRRAAAARCSALVVLGAALAMAPWWARNARVFGRFVPTTLWMGASLYDGLRPGATGASDMRFLADPDIWPLDEQAQDAELRRRAWAFVREHPGRALELAAIKLARFWSPWPNADAVRSPVVAAGRRDEGRGARGESDRADTVRSPVVAAVSAAVTLPQFALLALGGWDRRRDPRALVLLAGPLLYFSALHMVFVGSVRYRIPAAVPAMGLAAIGFRRVLGAWEGRRRVEDDRQGEGG